MMKKILGWFGAGAKRSDEGRVTRDEWREGTMQNSQCTMGSAAGRRTSGRGRMNAGATSGGWGAFERAFACAVVAVVAALWVGDARSSAWGAEAA